MTVFWLLALAFAVAFGGVAVLAWLVMEKGLRRSVVDRHRVLELLLVTDDVPEAWSGLDPAARLRRLDRLRRYVERTSLVESESTREEVLTRLAEVRAAWCGHPAERPADPAGNGIPLHVDHSRPVLLDGRRPQQEALETRDFAGSDSDSRKAANGETGL